MFETIGTFLDKYKGFDQAKMWQNFHKVDIWTDLEHCYKIHLDKLDSLQRDENDGLCCSTQCHRVQDKQNPLDNSYLEDRGTTGDHWYLQGNNMLLGRHHNRHVLNGYHKYLQDKSNRNHLSKSCFWSEEQPSIREDKVGDVQYQLDNNEGEYTI